MFWKSVFVSRLDSFRDIKWSKLSVTKSQRRWGIVLKPYISQSRCLGRRMKKLLLTCNQKTKFWVIYFMIYLLRIHKEYQNKILEREREREREETWLNHSGPVICFLRYKVMINNKLCCWKITPSGCMPMGIYINNVYCLIFSRNTKCI